MTSPSQWRGQLRAWWQELTEVPWRQMAAVLLLRFREARLGVSASSLTFTTVLALVPLFTVGLAVFAAFPVFGKFQDTVQRWLVESLVPESIARQVLGYLTQFARKASRLGTVGLVALVLSALALMVTIERTLGQIWMVRQQRRLAQRVLLYWAAITLGPLLLGASVAITSYVVTASRDVLPGGTRWLLDGFEFVLLVMCVSGLYFYVPFARVRWRHALTAGLMAALALELAKQLLAVYLTQIPTYSAIYGAFAALPILLVWIFVAWVVVLLGAVVAASLPELGRQRLRRPEGAGWAFGWSLEVLGALVQARQGTEVGLSAEALAERLRLPMPPLAELLETLQTLGWVGQLREGTGRYVLLVDPQRTPLAPLIEQQLLRCHGAAQPLWAAAGLEAITLAQALKN